MQVVSWVVQFCLNFLILKKKALWAIDTVGAIRPTVRCHIPEDWNIRGTNLLQIKVNKYGTEHIRQLSSSKCRRLSYVYCHWGRLSSCYFTELMRHELYNQILRISYRFSRTPSDWRRKQKHEVWASICKFIALSSILCPTMIYYYYYFFIYLIFCVGNESETQVFTLYTREMNGWHMAMPYPSLSSGVMFVMLVFNWSWQFIAALS